MSRSFAPEVRCDRCGRRARPPRDGSLVSESLRGFSGTLICAGWVRQDTPDPELGALDRNAVDWCPSCVEQAS